MLAHHKEQIFFLPVSNIQKCPVSPGGNQIFSLCLLLCPPYNVQSTLFMSPPALGSFSGVQLATRASRSAVLGPTYEMLCLTPAAVPVSMLMFACGPKATEEEAGDLRKQR